jgi:hypothetical protein
MKITATCIDRSNWCGEWQDTACTAGTGAVKGSRVSLGSNGPGLQYYSDSTLALTRPVHPENIDRRHL